MSTTIHQPRLRRLIDGGRTWGSLGISPSRYGLTRHHLVVFPPGISPDERVLLRLWRSWPIWGTLTWLTLEMFLIPTVGSTSAVVTSTVVAVGAGLVTMALTGANRTRVRTLTVVRIAGFPDPVATEAWAELCALACQLGEADRARDAGEISTVDHEAAVWRVYDRLGTHISA
ncbi:hypothetical protein CIW52_23015 [Mycolicibacterium sp. P9-64]|uniref:DUF6611 family protein n=1 Tax=Mycolicibacterium sp. P9-64 TaxID=2024612 RepID=UPI0011EDE9DE|nr:DUF6611 family protein [Mycolicibacterium sp. P9-64]KAA0080503.1 hypothetical protein CIW52_23015 [Mycolicibacterium sp. P9-64]